MHVNYIARDMVFGKTVISNNSCVQSLFSTAVMFKLCYFPNTFPTCVIFPNIL
jgi:hypothetical protein